MNWFGKRFGSESKPTPGRQFDSSSTPFRVDVTAPIVIYEASRRGDTSPAGREQVNELARLRIAESARCEEWFADHLEGDLASLFSGGELRLRLHEAQPVVIARIAFGASRRPTQPEVEALREHIHGQLLDGIGENFQQEWCYGRTFADQQAGKGSRLWLAFEEIDRADLDIQVTENVR